jgi:hypothetical protein
LQLSELRQISPEKAEFIRNVDERVGGHALSEQLMLIVLMRLR